MKTNDMYNLVKKLVAAYSVSGCEAPIAKVIEEEAKPYADEISTDAMGNLIVLKKGKSSEKRTMVAAHMDEIGFVVTSITDKGFVRVSNIGGIRPVYSTYQRVIFENGTKGITVLDGKAKLGEAKAKDVIVDIGANSKKDALKKVKVGDTCTVMPEIQRLMNGKYAAKALDDKIGVAVSLLALQSLDTPEYDTYFVFTTQEEVGLRGSKVAAFNVKPTYAIAVDVTHSGDTVGCDPIECTLGGGAGIKVKDSSVVCSKKIINALADTAKENNIKFQYEILEAGGTDTSSMQITGEGAYVGAISIPLRYMHSPVEVMDIKDTVCCAKLLKAFLERSVD